MLKKGYKKIKFDMIIPLPSWEIYACYFCHGNELGVIAIGCEMKMCIQCAHELLGHFNTDIKRKITTLRLEYQAWFNDPL